MFFNFDEYTINLNHVVSVSWDEEAFCASVVMAVGDDYDVDGEENYNAFKKVMGRK